MRSLWVSYSRPKEYHTLLLKVPHVSTLRNPKYLTPTYTGEVVAVSTDVEIREKKNCSSILIVGEQLFQLMGVSVTLYLHFYVVNPMHIPGGNMNRFSFRDQGKYGG